MIDRIRNTGVFGNALICEIDFAVLVQSYVFKQSVTFDCVVNIGLGILVEVDDLCIAATLEVEHAVVVPAVFVVADEQAFGIGGKSGFAGAAKTEEYSGVLSFHIGICRAVHGSNTLKRQIVVHHREHTLLHFSAVPGVYDNLFAAGDIEHNGGFGIETEFLVIFHFSLGSIVDYEIGLEVFEFFFGGFNEHVGYEMSLPCYFHNETDSHAGIFVCAAECVYDKQTLIGKLFLCDILNCRPCFLRCGMVVVFIFVRSPPHCILGIFVHNDELVFGRTSGINSGHDVYCAEFAYLPLLVAFESGFGFFFEQKLVRRIINDFCGSGNTVLSKIDFLHNHTS